MCSFQGTISSLVLLFYAGSLLLSHAVSSIVPSAVQVLTLVFGMGTRVPPGRFTTGKLFSVLFLLLSDTHN